MAEAVRRTGISKSTLQRYVKGETELSVTSAARIAAEAGVDLDWLITGAGAASAESKGFVCVPRYDVRLAAGPGAFLDRAQQLDEIPFTAEFLRKRLNRGSAEGLAILEASGDSMEPTIADGDLVMADLRQNGLGDGIYAFALGDQMRIKRLQQRFDGLEIISDNEKVYPREHLPGPNFQEEAEMFRGERPPPSWEEKASYARLKSLNIIGKIVWIGRVL